jgi:hypothetical protein
MLVAVLFWPSCFDVDFEQIDNLKRQGYFDFFEMDKEQHKLAIYWTNYRKIEFSLLRTKVFEAWYCYDKNDYAYFYYMSDEVIWSI